MSAMKQLVQDFRDYLDGLEKQQLLALLNDLIDDTDGLSAEQMYKILQRNKVQGYTAMWVTLPKSYTKDEAIAQSIKMGSKGNVEQVQLQCGLYWSDIDTGELWTVKM